MIKGTIEDVKKILEENGFKKGLKFNSKNGWYLIFSIKDFKEKIENDKSPYYCELIDDVFIECSHSYIMNGYLCGWNIDTSNVHLEADSDEDISEQYFKYLGDEK